MKFLPERQPAADKPLSFKMQHTERHCSASMAAHLVSLFSDIPPYRDIVWVNIGTDRSTGDSLGPLIGTRLSKYAIPGIHIYGTLDNPVHAMNLEETLQRIHESHHEPFIIGTDACLGQTQSVGCIQINQGPLKPGAGVKKELPDVGCMHITGIVNVGGFMEYLVLQNTRLSLVMNMADVISRGIHMAFLQTRRLMMTPPPAEIPGSLLQFER